MPVLLPWLSQLDQSNMRWSTLFYCCTRSSVMVETLSHLSPFSGPLTPSLSFPTWQHRPIFVLIPSMLTLLSFPPSKPCYSSFAWHTKAKQLLAPHHTLLQAQVPLAMSHEPVLRVMTQYCHMQDPFFHHKPLSLVLSVKLFGNNSSKSGYFSLFGSVFLLPARILDHYYLAIVCGTPFSSIWKIWFDNILLECK